MAATWSPTILNYVHSLANESEQGKELASDDVDFPGSASTDTPYSKMLRYLASDESDAMAPVNEDTHHPISDYFISSSHNTYLWGNQLYGKASTRAYQNVLERGCRCVEIDVWDGETDTDSSESSSEGEDENEGKMRKFRKRFKRKVGALKSKVEGTSDETSPPSSSSPGSDTSESIRRTMSNKSEPRVLHGYTATREISFRHVCTTIRDHAFTNSELPLIVSLEVHTCPAQQQIMVDIMKELWAPHLVDVASIANKEVPLPTLDFLRKKILIKVKYSSPEAASGKKPATGSKTTDLDSSEDEAQENSVKKSNVIASLGSMGVYTRSCHFKGFDQPEAKTPTHIFSLSESKLIEVHKRDPSVLFKHNKRFMMRVYPKGVRVSSSNLDPAPFWRMGAQIVALNWQYINAATMLNQALFHGTGGWVLKPEGYRSSHTAEAQTSALKRGRLDLSIEILAGQSIGPIGENLKPYVRCELHVEDVEEVTAAQLPEGGKTKDGQIKTSTEVGQGGRDPDFGRQVLRFRDIPGVSDEMTFVRFKVMDDDTFSRDNLVAWACYRLNRLQTGIRKLHLYGTEGQPTDGMLLVRISKNLRME